MNYNLIPNQTSTTRKVVYTITALFAVVAVVALVVVPGRVSVTSNIYKHSDLNSVVMNELYTQWKLAYGIQYLSEAEDSQKFQTFQNNYLFILNWNSKKDQTSTVGLNQFAAMTTAEFSAHISCLNGGAFAKTSTNEETAVVELNAPATVDWRQKGAVTPVKNQGQCGSCWAFSSTGALEGLNFIKNGNLLSFSEQQLVDCSQSYGNQGCNGGLMDNAFKYTAAKGIELESTYPYKGVDGKCKYSKTNVKFQNKAYSDVAANSQSALQNAIAQQPTSVAVEADQPVFQMYTSGVITSSSCGTNLDHGILGVGYDANQKFWIVKNSWGGSWGEKGYVRIGMNGDGAGICGIQQMDSYPTA